MRFVLSLLASLAFMVSAKADTFFSPAQVIYTVTNTVTFGITNQTVQLATNNIEFGLYHTFQVAITSSDTNVLAHVAIDRSLDGVHWTVVGTNANAAATSSGSGEQTMTGKWTWVRYRAYGSNVVGTVYYLGGR